MAYQRGLDKSQEQDHSLLIRDTRTLGRRVYDFLQNPRYVAVVLMMFAFGSFAAPAMADILLVIGVLMFIYTKTRKAVLPYRLPQRAGLPDYNDPLPGSGKPRKARGIYFFGNEKKQGSELWFNNDDMRTHALIFGSTGSGKTEALVSIAFNALLQGSGFIYVDGKGDNSLFAKVFSMVRYMGREDDLLLINFMTGARDIIGPQEKRISNTMNPFASGSSSMLTQLIVSMMDEGSSGGDGDMWKGRAIAFVEALMKVLTAMRDAGHILLDANSIRYYFTLERLESMTMDKRFPRQGLEAVSLESLPETVMDPLVNYVLNLPGYNKERKGKQVSQVFEQHGFITMQLTRVFTSLADTYGHIVRTRLPEVEMKDVVLNRRILVVLLPALEKSPAELSNLGKVVIASLKTMMAAGLGDEVEGKFRDLVERKPTNAPSPYLCILDEYGYYAVKGFAVVPAQARSLGFSVIFAGQDLPAFQKASKEEAASIGANTNIKVCMKLEDPQETWEFFQKTAGESYVAHVSGFQANSGGVSNSYMDTRGASIEKRARIDLQDLKEQREGEGHIFFKSRIERMSFFFANPKPVKALRLNQLLKVDRPPDSDLYVIAKGIEDFEAFVKAGDYAIPTPVEQSGVRDVVDLFAAQDSSDVGIERAIGVLLAYHDQNGQAQAEGGSGETGAELREGEVTIFNETVLTDAQKAQLLGDHPERYAQPLLSASHTESQLVYVQRMLGGSEQMGQMIGQELIDDMRAGTHYPPRVATERIPDTQTLVATGERLIEHISVRVLEEKQRAATKQSETDKS